MLAAFPKLSFLLLSIINDDVVTRWTSLARWSWRSSRRKGRCRSERKGRSQGHPRASQAPGCLCRQGLSTLSVKAAETPETDLGHVPRQQGKEHLLVTRNLVPGESVYGEKRISIEQPSTVADAPAEKVEYRVWNPFRSKLAAGILGGLDNIHIGPGKKVLYLGAASGTSVSHVADVVGPVSLDLFPTCRRGNEL